MENLTERPTLGDLLDMSEKRPHPFMFMQPRTINKKTLYLSRWEARLCDVWQETCNDLEKVYGEKPLDWRKITLLERRRDERFQQFIRFIRIRQEGDQKQ